MHEEPYALVGAVLDRRWRLTRLVGAGAIGIVFEAEGLEGQDVRALKLLRAEFADDAQVVERFLDEARASARVVHPGIARVEAAGRAEDGTPYLVMEMLRGMPLVHRMNRGRLPVEQAAPIAHDVLSALGAAHAAGIVHRDLKPENVFLERDREGDISVKLLDLGIARVVDAAGGTARRTHTGMLLGTAGYMSPEQVQDAKRVDARTDLWAVGILFYEMLTGTPAYAGENEFDRMIRVLHADPEPIERAAPQFAHWSGFFRKALARDPALRFQSAGEMAAALREVARGGQLPTSGFGAIRMSEPPVAAVDSVVLAMPDAPFPKSDTAVSATGRAAGARAEQPSVEVRVLGGRGVAVWVVAAVAVAALLAGFALGFLVGRG